MVRPKYLIILVDLFAAIVSLFAAYFVRFGGADSWHHLFAGGLFRVVAYLLVVLFAAYFFSLFDFRKFGDSRFVITFCCVAAFVSFLVLSALFYMLPEVQFGRGILFIAISLFCAIQVALRLLIRKSSKASVFATRTLIVGAGDLAQQVYDIVPQDDNIHSLTRFISCTEKEPTVDSDLIVGNIKDLNDILSDYRPHLLILSLTDRRGRLPLKDIMHSKLRGVEVIDATTYYERTKQCLMIEKMQPSEFIYTDRFKMTAFMRSYKRLFDVVMSLIGLTVASPVLPIIALAVKMDSSGPIFYKQLRVGENENEYFVYKFRTMAQDAETKSGAVWAQKNDPRVTKVGRFLRKTRLDEIPQLYNVLKGDMSFIGPRPERMAFVERLKETIPFYSTRHFVKPGVTGLAQVCYPYGASDEDALEKLRYDLYYVKNYSIFLDFKIIIDTIRVVVSGFGGR